MKKIVCLFACLFVGSANATLVGDTVSIEITNGSFSYGLNTHTVGAGEEGNYFGNQFYDFSDFSFDIRSTNSFCGMSCNGGLITLSLTDLDFGEALDNVLFTTNLNGVSLDFGSNYVNFSWVDQSLSPTTYLFATFETSSTSVPEPASLALLGLGLAGIGFSRKKYLNN